VTPVDSCAAISSDAPLAWQAVEFDFAEKSTAVIPVERVADAMASGRYVWIDIDYADRETARRAVADLGYLAEPLLHELFSGTEGTRVSRRTDYLHMALCDCRIDSGGQLIPEPVDAVVTEGFLLTLHRGPRAFLQLLEQEYEQDFIRFAQTPSFLVYEIWENLIEHYATVQEHLERSVQTLQSELIKTIDDQVFLRVSEIGENLLHFRAVLVPTRGVLTELASRRSIFVSEATQASLTNMVATLERVLQDVLVDRDIIAQALNLHMSMVSHRTNRAMNKLTVINTIFLPLAFLAGIYGMNFDAMPELHWRYGYGFFWIMTVIIVVVLVAIMRKTKLL